MTKIQEYNEMFAYYCSTNGNDKVRAKKQVRYACKEMIKLFVFGLSKDLDKPYDNHFLSRKNHYEEIILETYK